MEPAILISALSLAVAAIGFFYKIGRDTKQQTVTTSDDSKLEQIINSVNAANKKLDDIAEWQREATKIHTSHEERIKTLFNSFEHVESEIGYINKRLEDREVINKSLQKILERLG